MIYLAFNANGTEMRALFPFNERSEKLSWFAVELVFPTTSAARFISTRPLGAVVSTRIGNVARAKRGVVDEAEVDDGEHMLDVEVSELTSGWVERIVVPPVICVVVPVDLIEERVCNDVELEIDVEVLVEVGVEVEVEVLVEVGVDRVILVVTWVVVEADVVGSEVVEVVPVEVGIRLLGVDEWTLDRKREISYPTKFTLLNS